MNFAAYSHPERDEPADEEAIAGAEYLREKREQISARINAYPQVVSCSKCGEYLNFNKSRRSKLWFVFHSSGKCEDALRFWHLKIAGDRESAIAAFRLL